MREDALTSTAPGNDNEYDGVARFLHWATAVFVIVLIGLGVVMTNVNGGDSTLLHRAHVGLGLLLTFATIFRIGWRLAHRSPPAPPMPTWRRVAYGATHAGLQLGLLAIAATGVSILVVNEMAPIPGAIEPSELEDGPANTAHLLATIGFVVLVLVHVLGVLAHQRTRGDVLSRMRGPFPGRASGPKSSAARSETATAVRVARRRRLDPRAR